MQHKTASKNKGIAKTHNLCLLSPTSLLECLKRNCVLSWQSNSSVSQLRTKIKNLAIVI